MAGETITQLPVGIALTGSEVAPFVQSGNTVQITANQISTFVNAQAGAGTVQSVSAINSNGFFFSILNPTTTPSITLSTTVNGIVQGDGTSLSAASTTGSGSVVLASSSSITIAGHTVTLGGTQTLAASDLTNGTTGTGSIVLASAPTISNLTVTTGFTATGLVTNADLVNSSVTIAGQTVALGASASIAASDLSNGVNGTGAIVLTTGASLVTPTLGVAAATSIALGTASAQTGSISFANSASAYLVTLKAAATTTGSYNFVLPVNGGSAGFILATDGAGNTSWTAPSSGAVPVGGTTGQVLSKIDATNYNTQWSNPGSGVTSFSIATANGLAGTVTTGVTPIATLTTTITGLLQGNGTAISAATTTGTGAVVQQNSPVISQLTVTTGFTATGLVTAADLASTTGTGAVVLQTSPALVTPSLGAATATSLAVNGITLATGTVFGVTGNAVLQNLAIGGATLGSNALAVTGHLLLEGVTSTGATGLGALVFNTSPTLTTPVLGAAAGTSLALGTASAQTGAITFANSASAYLVTLKAGATTTTGGYNFVLPLNPGTSGYVLSTDGAGNTSWVVQGTGAVPIGGTTGQALVKNSNTNFDTIWATVSGAGTVTSFAFTTANGLSGTVSNATLTPNLTLSTTVSGILQGVAGAITQATATGTGLVVLSNSPTISQLTVTTGFTATGLVTNADLASTTGTGAVVLQTSPALITPNIGAATATTINNLTLTNSVATITLTTGAVLTVSASATVSGTNTGDQTITLTSDVTGSGTGSFPTTIANNAVSNAKFRQSNPLSVIGRSTNTTGNVADIAGTANQVLVVNTAGTSLGFGAVQPAGGGTGLTTLTTGAILVGNGTSSLSQVGAGAAGTFLTGQGSGTNPSFTATPVLGVNGSTAGTLSLANGAVSGAFVVIQNTAATTAYNFNLPATPGTAGQALISGGGGTAAMTWGSAGTGTVTSVAVTSGNGLAGTVTNPSGAASIALSTTVNGAIFGNGTALAAISFATTTGTGATGVGGIGYSNGQMWAKGKIFPTGDTTGATDLTNINAALVSGASVQLAEGNFYINGPILFPVNPAAGVRLNGSGSGTTIINQVTTAANGINVLNTSPSLTGGSITNLTLSGATGSTGIALDMQYIGADASSGPGGSWVVSNVTIQNFNSGMRYRDAWWTNNSNITITNFALYGIWLTKGSVANTGGHNFSNIQLINPIPASNPLGSPIIVNTLSTGIYVAESGGALWSNVVEEGCLYGLLIRPASAGYNCFFQWFSNCSFDNNGTTTGGGGIWIDTNTNGYGRIQYVFFDNCLSSYTNNVGLVFYGVDTYTFTVTSANATAGAGYTNSGISFIVSSTISGGTTLTTTGPTDPAGSGTLTRVTGSGDATITYSGFTVSPTISDVNWTGGSITTCYYQDVTIYGGTTRVKFSSTSIVVPNAIGGSYDAVVIGGFGIGRNTHLAFTGNVISGGTYGVHIPSNNNTGTDYVIVNGNDLSGNTFAGFNDAVGLGHIVNANNLT